MEKNYQIQVSVINYDSPNTTVNKMVTSEELEKFRPIIKVINNNTGADGYKHNWNWFDHLPETWNGNDYVLDTQRIKREFNKYFGAWFTPNDIVTFFKKFTPNGGDGISVIRLFEVKEINF